MMLDTTRYVSMPHAALWVVQLADIRFRLMTIGVQCRTRLCGWCSADRLHRPHVPVSVSMPHAALWVVQPR